MQILCHFGQSDVTYIISLLFWFQRLQILGEGGYTKSNEFWEKFQMAFDPPPHFWKIILQFFYNRYGCIYARRYDGQMVWNACRLQMPWGIPWFLFNLKRETFYVLNVIQSWRRQGLEENTCTHTSYLSFFLHVKNFGE